jgi:hypothetical protein
MTMATAKNKQNKGLRRIESLASLFICIMILAACGGQGGQPPVDSAPFKPPTLSAQDVFPTQTPLPSAAPTLSIATLRVTPTLPCTNSLTYESDVTIPDGTKVAPGASLDKRWQVKNSGTCNWDARYAFKLIDGNALGLASDQALFPALAGSEAVLRLVFTAPPDPGNYRSAWQAFGPDGQPFGDPVYIEVVVTTP